MSWVSVVAYAIYSLPGLRIPMPRELGELGIGNLRIGKGVIGW